MATHASGCVPFSAPACYDAVTEEAMGIAKRRLILGGFVSAVLLTACNNDNFSNRGAITAATRFQLVVTEQPNPARLLFDSATGDLWELRTEAASGAQWVRLASGPADIRSLTPGEILGGHAPRTPKS